MSLLARRRMLSGFAVKPVVTVVRTVDLPQKKQSMISMSDSSVDGSADESEEPLSSDNEEEKEEEVRQLPDQTPRFAENPSIEVSLVRVVSFGGPKVKPPKRKMSSIDLDGYEGLDLMLNAYEQE